MHCLALKDCAPEADVPGEDKKLTTALQRAFTSVDAEMLALFHRNGGPHFAASTGVTAIVHDKFFTIAHVGDSRACLFRRVYTETNDECYASFWLTRDHKPNVPEESERIRNSGGSVVYLNEKPFIRGGDFLARLATGERPKQVRNSAVFAYKLHLVGGQNIFS